MNLLRVIPASFLTRSAVLWLGAILASHGGQTVDLRPYWDAAIPLENPHKGWYHHYPDNHLNKYKIGRDEDLLEFPGMDHLYIRLAWAYLEPKEGQFDWEVVDSLIGKWTAHGLGIAFRISCKETSTDRVEQQYATPLWVKEAGAQGGYYRQGKPTGPDGPWEPAFDDPIFLQKLERFLAAFAARYDGQPWLRYVDIGSIGDWGEGHTWAGSQREYGYEARKVHVDLHLKYFRKSQLILSDDFLYGISEPNDRRRLHEYAVAQGISYRDDSILVNGYLAGHSDTDTVRSPQFFEGAYLKLPTVFELEHYGSVKRLGNWSGRPDSLVAKHGGGKTGPDYFRGALRLLHATYIGYHGDAREWLTDNPDLTVELLNRCGYWYFLERVELPETLRRGEEVLLVLVWQNRGVAPAYQPYRLMVRGEGPQSFTGELDAGNQRWLPEPPGQAYRESYRLAIPESLKPGAYTLKVKLHSEQARRDVELALKPELMDEEGFYRIGEVECPGDGRPVSGR